MSLYKQSIVQTTTKARSPIPALQPYLRLLLFTKSLLWPDGPPLSPHRALPPAPVLSPGTPSLLRFLPMFARAATRDCHKFGDLKQRSFTHSRVWRPDSKLQVWAGQSFLWKLREGSLPHLLQRLGHGWRFGGQHSTHGTEQAELPPLTRSLSSRGLGGLVF